MIQKLEEELDVKIFSRDRKNIAPTAIGEKIIRQAQIALNESQRIKELVSDETGTMKGCLRIGILPTIAPYLVPDFIHHFRSAHPDVDLFIDEKENASLVRELRFGNIDIAISTLPEDREGILEIPVYIEKFVAYFSSGCSQAQKIIASGNLPAEHMWILKEGHCVPNGAMNFCKNQGYRKPYLRGREAIETLVRIVDRNGGYTIIPELHIPFLSDVQKENVVHLNVNPPAQRCISILIKDDFIRERAVNAVLETLKSIIPSYMMEERLRKHKIKLR